MNSKLDVMQKWNLSLSIIAIIVSIAAICFVLLRCEPLMADWMSVLVGILSLLTASLIGWQIYRTIELDRTIRRFDRIVNDRALVVARDINHIITAFEHRLSSSGFIAQHESQEKSIMYLMAALEEVTNIQTPGANEESIDKIMQDFQVIIDEYKNKKTLMITEVERDRYLMILKKIEHKKSLSLTKYISRTS